MPLPIPNLDDRTYDQLAAEARSLIPKNYPVWTDYNSSDPGITLLQLFAFVFEAAIYQLNRVPERSLERFAELVGVTRAPDEPIAQMLRRAVESLQTQSRAVTADDIEALVAQNMPGAFSGKIARVKAIVETMPAQPNIFPNEQLVQVLIVPSDPSSDAPQPSPELCQEVFDMLRPRCLIATRVQVLAPIYTSVTIDVTVVRDLRTRLARATVRQNVEQQIELFLSPLKGGADRKGWEFGRPVFRSELYRRIEQVEGVDHVRRLALAGSETQSEVRLASPQALVQLKPDALTLTVVEA